MRLLMLKRATTVLIWAASSFAQQPAASKSLAAAAAERFNFGKSIYVKNEHGSAIPFDVINSDIQGWGRFVMAGLPDKADLIAEVTSTENGGVTVGSKTDYATPDGKPRESSSTNKDLSASSVTLKVFEAKTRRELWTGNERVKSAFKKKAGEDNMVASAEKLFKRFHDYVEPPGR